MGKPRYIFKKIGDIKGTLHVRMGMIKDRNDKDLTEAEVNVFLQLPCFLHDPIIWSLCLFEIQLVHLGVPGSILLKPSLKDFEHNLASMWNEHNCTVVWTFFGITFLWDWNEDLTFSSSLATTKSSKFVNISSVAF